MTTTDDDLATPSDTETDTETDTDAVAEDGAGHEPGGQDARDGGSAGVVVQGEVLTASESAAVDRRLSRQAVVRVGAMSTQVVRAARSDRSKVIGQAVLRHSVITAQGLGSWARRGWDAGTLGVYRRQIAAAEATGNQELLAEWTQRREQAVEARHKRLLDLPATAISVAKAAAGIAIALVTTVVLLATLVQVTGVGRFVDVVNAVVDVIRWVCIAATIVWTPLLMLAMALVVLAAWREGRRRANPPGWLVTAAEADVDATIDETTIARALQALRIPQITAYMKEGHPLQYLTPARVDGRGTHAVLRLPPGVTAEKVERRRADLATGLHRLSKEVWPTTGAEAGILDLWVADKGALAEGAGPYPLLEHGEVDIFKGVPFGSTLRGTPVTCPVMERNTLTGGMPGQGKSSAARVVMAGAALDPTAELRIWVPDSNYDFEVFRPRCSRYVMGADDDKITEIAEHLRELHAEVQARGDLLVKYETPAVTRELANKGVGLHPVVCLLEEAHIAIQHEEHGKEISKLLVSIVKLGRKRGIHMVVSTQAPTRESMPRDVTRNCSNGIAFAVGDHIANDALLGQGAYSAGHRATALMPGTDRGTAVVKGFSGQRSEIVQVYYLDVDRTNDQVTPIITRSLAAIERRGTAIPGHGRKPRQAETRDLLADLDAVLGDDPVPSADVPALLARHAPAWTPYRRMTGKSLRQELAEHGITVPSTGNRWPVNPATIRHTLATRHTDHDPDGLDDVEDAAADGE